MSSLKRKPKLPVGMAVPQFPPIRRALHADENFEVYLLDETKKSSLVLFVCLDTKGSEAFANQLTAWWDNLGSDRISVKNGFRICADGITRREAVLEIFGSWMGVHADETIDEPTLYAQFGALIESAVQAGDEQLIPNLEPTLLWKSLGKGETRITPVVVVASADEEAEKPIIRRIGTAFYWVATGIDLSLAPARQVPKPLSRWCKTAGSKLSALTARCLGNPDAPDHVRSLAELRDELSVQLHGEASDKERVPIHRTRTGSSATEPRGLAKVAGMHVLKELLERDIIKPLRDPEPFRRYGLSIPNGMLLFGPPGCGKTYIARQLAEELGYYFSEIIPSEVAGIHIHESVLRVREAFEGAAERAPSIVFIDEFDALVPSRSGLGGHQQYKSEEVNEFLAQLNSCAEKKVFVIAATNEPEKIDPAIRRTGRLDKLVYVGPPDSEARTEMLRLHLTKRPLDDSLALAPVSLVLEGYSASDIKFLVDEAARLALRRGVPISSEILMEASRSIPPSVTKEMEKRFRFFEQRGNT